MFKGELNIRADELRGIAELKKTGRMLEAFTKAKSLMTSYPLCPTLLRTFWELSFELGYNALGEKLLKRGHVLAPDDSAVLMAIATHAEGYSMYREACKFFQRTILVKPSGLISYYKLLCIYESYAASCTWPSKRTLLEKSKQHQVATLIEVDKFEKQRDLVNAIFLLDGILRLEFSDQKLAKSANYRLNKLIKDVIRFMHANNNGRIGFRNYSQTLDKLYQISLDRRIVFRPKELAVPILSLIKLHPLLTPILSNFRETGEISNITRAVEYFTKIILLMKIMELCPIFDLELEKILTRLRRYFLETDDHIALLPVQRTFLKVLIKQCAINEYIWSVTGEEQKAIDNLLIEIQLSKPIKEKAGDVRFYKLALYKPIHRLAPASFSVFHPDDKALEDILINEPNYEEKLKLTIPRLTAVEQQKDNKVRFHYEENPYPRWLQTGLALKARSPSKLFKEIGLRLDWDILPGTTAPRVLVAGCGTGQHAINTACRFQNSTVLAIDISTASLAYAKRKTEELGISRIEYAHADILKLKPSEYQFNIVESAGVLHHLPQPLEGLKILTELLKPGGLIFLGLYSRSARRSVSELRKLLRSVTVTHTIDSLRHYRQLLLANKHPAIDALVNWADFYCASELNDLLFHPLEHVFDLLEIESALRSSGLSFVGFESYDHNFKKRFQAKYPSKNDFYDLRKWHDFEQAEPHTFAGMYQFWAQKLPS